MDCRRIRLDEEPPTDREREESEGEGGDSDGKDEAEENDVSKQLRFHLDKFETNRIDPEKPMRHHSIAQWTTLGELQESIKTAVEETADRVARQSDESRPTSRKDLTNVDGFRDL